MTPQQLARAYVADSRMATERGFYEYASQPGMMEKVWKKLFDMADNGNMKAINAIIKLTVTSAESKTAGEAEKDAPIVFQINNAAAGPPPQVTRVVSNESKEPA